MRVLNKNEMRDTIKFIKTGSPVADTCRFLFFGDKREVEFIWNGKTDEACNIVLPFQAIEQVDAPRIEKMQIALSLLKRSSFLATTSCIS